MRSQRQPRRHKHPLHRVFIHRRSRPQHPRPHVRNVGQLKQPLHRAILAKRSMQHRKHHIQPRPRTRRRSRLHNRNPRLPVTRVPQSLPELELSLETWDVSSACAAPPCSQRPSGLIPSSTTSYFFRSIAFKIDRAERSDTSCSPLRPPNKIPTRSFFFAIPQVSTKQRLCVCIQRSQGTIRGTHASYIQSPTNGRPTQKACERPPHAQWARPRRTGPSARPRPPARPPPAGSCSAKTRTPPKSPKPSTAPDTHPHTPSRLACRFSC